MRAIESHARLKRVAESVSSEMDDLTDHGGIPRELDPEDSAVHAIERVFATGAKS